jgi:hypothetical protein
MLAGCEAWRPAVGQNQGWFSYSIISGSRPSGEMPEKRIGVQFHPELKSRPFAPHPLFASFVEAAVEQSRLV